MHGQKRSEYKARQRNDAISAKLSQKAQQWNTLITTLHERRSQLSAAAKTDSDEAIHKKNTHHFETLKLTEKLLSVNPDPINIWNHRRQLLVVVCLSSGCNDQPPMTLPEFLSQEQIVTATSLKRNPKAYAAWFHRKWSIQQFLVHSSKTMSPNHSINEHHQQILESELDLCSEFLQLDERNFHCWNYRRFIVSALGCCFSNRYDNIDGSWNVILNCIGINNKFEKNAFVDENMIGAQIISSKKASRSSPLPTSFSIKETELMQKLIMDEFEFTTQKILQNFSNGSAFHYRSKLLPILLCLQSKQNSYEEIYNLKKSFAVEELDLVRNAIYTEPDDQTPWWYFRFIISWTHPGNGKPEEIHDFVDMLKEEWTCIEELVEAEGGKCKWGILGLHLLASTLFELGFGLGDDEYIDTEYWKQKTQECLILLQELDPVRNSRYCNMMVS